MLRARKILKFSASLMVISAVASALAGCEATRATTPNTPQFSQCYNQETNTAKNCEEVDFKKILESKQEWKINSYNLKGKTISLKQTAESPFVVRFNNNEINGTLGCNHFFGKFSIEGNHLKLENAGMTRKMCAPEVMIHEDTLAQNFLNVSTKIVMIEEAKKVSKIFFVGKDFYLVLN